ncbi:MAG TPA: TetR-like C-terminal domain-containing protein [Rhizobiaceae bacterium]|nr:TetR-like C-terminal domain-containing protein [Rhizobiaceae bacterium]
MKKKTRSGSERILAGESHRPVAAPAERARKKANRPYHHGALREALLNAAEAILDKDGINGLTLRAAARNAGASHAAPKNHFGDLTGLLSELAALGFQRFSAELRAAAEAETDPDRRGKARGRAYVHFAERHPGLFQLMFRSERLDPSRPALREAMDGAAQALADVVDEGQGESPGRPPLARAAQMVAAWSLVHGFSMLLLDGRLAAITRQLPDGLGTEDLLAEMLEIRSPGKRVLSTP